MYQIDGYSRIKTDPHNFEFNRKGGEWRFVGEEISGVPDAMYPPDEKVVQAIKAFEPEFVPLWIRSAYESPAGSLHIFGRHAIAVSPRDPEMRHQVIRALMPTGQRSPSYPLVINDILQDRSVEIVPSLKVYGYKPFDWGVYHAARASWNARKGTQNAERDAADYFRDFTDSRASALARSEAEADYRFDHVTNHGRTIKAEFDAMTASDWANLGQQKGNA